MARRRSLPLLAAALALAALAGCGRADPHGAQITRLAFHSAAVGRTEHVTVVVPPGSTSRPRPLLVFLHGRGGDDESELGTQSLFDELRRLGPRAPAIAFPDGGDASYWHARGDGDWARYVTGEVIPRVARRFGLDARRVAIGGISMGGFGALDLAEARARRWCAVGAHSPALWRTAGETASGAFDDARDFAAHDVVAIAGTAGGAAALRAQPLWIDAGDEDPFLPGDQAFVAALRAAGDAGVALSTRPGGHDGGYWDGRWPEYLRFYAAALARCR